MDFKQVLLTWPDDHDVTDAFCLVGSGPGLDKCFRFDLLPSGARQATLELAPGTYEVKVNLLAP
jgi:hypothetical protein